MVVAARARAQCSAAQRSTASGFSCTRGVIVLGAKMGRGAAFESILAPLPPPSVPQLPRDYLVGAVATNPTPDLTPHSVGEGARGPSPADLETRLLRAAASCHPMPNRRALSGCGVDSVCVCSYSSHATQTA